MNAQREIGFVSCCTALTFLLASFAALSLSHHPFHNPRLLYGFRHLPLELFSASVFAAVAGLAVLYGSRVRDIAQRPSLYFVLALMLLFLLYWLPVLLTAGFVQDDWQLLAAASIRTSILHHPLESWYALDSVDGNFRPFGTVLYLGYALKYFGLCAPAFLIANFLFNLGAVLASFFIVCELGYSRVAAAAAAVLYLSRGILYTQSAWVAALGDSTVTLLCALTILFLLKACRRSGAQALAWHLLAWFAFLLSTLAKQSSFTIPLMVALLLLIRPGLSTPIGLPRRIFEAAAAVAFYLATAAVIFVHGRSLFHAQTPYPIKLTFDAIFRTFSYVCWYFAVIQLPNNFPGGGVIPSILGLLIVVSLALLARRFPRCLGTNPRDILFLIAAGVASLSIFVVLANRGAPYYGSIAAFFFSMALGIALTRFGPITPGNRAAGLCLAIFYLLAVVGFMDIRVKQTGLVPSGGYIWGTFGMDTERSLYRQLQSLLASQPHPTTVVFVDAPGASYCASMALVADPALTTILAYDSAGRVFLANDRAGARPIDDAVGLGDVMAYNWLTPIAEVPSTLNSAVWLAFTNNKFVRASPPPTPTANPAQ